MSQAGEEKTEYQEYRDLPTSKKLRLWAYSIGRLIVGFILILVFMWVTPDQLTVGVAIPVAMLLVGVTLYILYFKRQIRLITRSKFPMFRAVESLVLVIALFLAMFAVSYVMIENSTPGSFTEPLDDFTAFYYAMTVLATVGFGDITPVSTLARSLSMVQMAIDITIVGVAFKLLSGSAQKAIQQRKQNSQQAHKEQKDDVKQQSS